MKRDHSTLHAMAQPKHWLKLPVYVNDSQIIGGLNRCSAGIWAWVTEGQMSVGWFAKAALFALDQE